MARRTGDPPLRGHHPEAESGGHATGGLARDWNAFYSSPEFSEAAPDPLLSDAIRGLPPGRALDLASGAGRHSILLAHLGWQVTAVDSAPAAIERLRRAAPHVDARLVDLETGGFAIRPGAWDLICDFYYLQRSLFPAIRDGVRPGGLFVGAIHLLEEGRNPRFALPEGALRTAFADWEILSYYEGGEPARRRRSARIVARRSISSL